MSEEDDEKDREIGERYSGCPPVDWGSPTAVANFAVPGPHYGVLTHEHEGRFHVTLFLPPDTVSEDGRPVHVLGLSEHGSSRDMLFWNVGRILTHLGREGRERRLPAGDSPCPSNMPGSRYQRWTLPNGLLTADPASAIALWCAEYSEVVHQKGELEKQLRKVEAELQQADEKLRAAQARNAGSK